MPTATSPESTKPRPPQHASPDPSTFTVAILGGGIGGLTTALSLTTHLPTLRHVTVYEQAPAYREIGAGVGLGVNAGRILQKIGVWEAASKISGERNGVHRCMRRWDDGGDIVTQESMDEEKGVRQLSVHRAEFLEVLVEEIGRRQGRVRLETDKRAVRVEDSGPTVTIHFADGTTATANLVIASDGIHSAIRSQFAIDKPTYSGRIAYRGLLPLSAVSDHWPYPSYAVSWLAPNKHFLVFPVSQNRTLNVVGFVTKAESELGDLRESWTSTCPREDIEREYEGWDETVERIVRNMEPRVGKWKLNDRELLAQWVYMDGKVVLAGDAAHAMLPHQGSGAGHAIEDAYILGLALRDFFRSSSSSAASLSTFMTLYQRVRLPRAQKAQITSRQAGDVYEMQGPAFEGLSYEECLPIVAEKLKGRMRWVWSNDLEGEYEAVKGEVLRKRMEDGDGRAGKGVRNGVGNGDGVKVNGTVLG